VSPSPLSFRQRLFAWLNSDAVKMLDTVPGPRPSFPLGNLMALAKEELHTLMGRWHAAYGDVLVFWAFGQPTLLVNEPRLLQQILVDRREDYFKNVPRAAARPILGESVFRARGGREAIEKRRHHPLEAPDIGAWYDRMLVLLDPVLELALAEGLPPPGGQPREVDLFELVMQATFQVLGRAVLGTGLSRRHFQDYLAMLREMGKRGSLPIAFSPSPVFWFRRWRWLSFIEDRLRDGASSPAGFDIASRMRGSRLPRRYVRDEVSSIFLAGLRNIATAVTMTVYLVARHPEVARRLREEIDAGTGGPRRPLDRAALRRLEYLDRVLKESMRLYSAVPGFVREVKHDRSVVLGKVTLPPATQIFIAPWTLHRNPRLWPDPLRFDPDRFLVQPAPGHYMPFGHGPRSCVGAELTITCAKGMLVSLLSRYTVTVRPDFEMDVAMSSATTYPRNGLPALLGERPRPRPAGASSGSRQTPSSP